MDENLMTVTGHEGTQTSDWQCSIERGIAKYDSSLQIVSITYK
jgi:hypothetical protein